MPAWKKRTLKERKKSRSSVIRKRQVQVPRISRLIVVRHGERLDKVFAEVFRGRRYIRTDANQPLHLPIRGRAFRDYQADPPLTEFGRHLASQLRLALATAGIRSNVVLSSPALRCVETASLLLQRGQRVCVEPALHENWVTQPGVDPNDAYLAPAEYLAAGFAVDTTYAPTQRLIAINQENARAYFRRFSRSLDALISRMDGENPGGTVILVGHSSTLDAVYGHLIGENMESFDGEGHYVGNFEREPPYTQAMVLERTRDGGWAYKEGAIKAYTSTGFTTANELQEEEEVDGDEEESEDED